jgi:hypothetical protein
MIESDTSSSCFASPNRRSSHRVEPERVREGEGGGRHRSRQARRAEEMARQEDDGHRERRADRGEQVQVSRDLAGEVGESQTQEDEERMVSGRAEEEFRSCTCTARLALSPQITPGASVRQ